MTHRPPEARKLFDVFERNIVRKWEEEKKQLEGSQRKTHRKCFIHIYSKGSSIISCSSVANGQQATSAINFQVFHEVGTRRRYWLCVTKSSQISIFYLCLFYHPFYMYLTNTRRYLECHRCASHRVSRWNRPPFDFCQKPCSRNSNVCPTIYGARLSDINWKFLLSFFLDIFWVVVGVSLSLSQLSWTRTKLQSFRIVCNV